MSEPTRPLPHPITLAGAQAALAAERYETARRIGRVVMSSRRLLGGGGPSGPERSGGAAPVQTRTWDGEAGPCDAIAAPAERGKFSGSLSDGTERAAAALVLHDALARLGDLPAALALLDDLGTGFEACLRRAQDLNRAAAFSFYRTSPEKARGLTYEESLALLAPRRTAAARALAEAVREPAQAVRAIAALRAMTADHERRCAAEGEALAALTAHWPAPSAPAASAPVQLRLSGRLRFPGGCVQASTITLGITAAAPSFDPAAADIHVIGIGLPPAGAIATLQAPLAADGTFAIAGAAPAGTGFLAITLADAEADGVPTRFLLRDLPCDGRPLADVDLTVEPWRSAPAATHGDPLPTTIRHHGRTWRRLATETLHNPFWHDFPRQDLHLDWPVPVGSGLAWDGSQAIPHQRDAEGRVLLFTDLPARSTRHLGWYGSDQVGAPVAGGLLAVDPSGASAVIDTGRSRFRIPWGSSSGSPPILAVMGPDRTWRGAGRWELSGRSAPACLVALRADGPLELQVEVAYRFDGGERCTFLLTAHAGAEHLLVEERGEALPGTAFVLGLDEFLGGRGYLHWCAEGESAHWHGLETADRELARLQESVPWWIPPAGFAWAATFDGLDRRDLVAVCTRRRGDWVDHAFAAIAAGPPPGGHELDWPYPEMVGSTISMITVASTASGRLEMRFPRFAGVRHWALIAGDFARGDGPAKSVQQVHESTSYARLDEVRRWRLDEPDRVERPCLLVHRQRLPWLRAHRDHPAIAPHWAKVRAGTAAGSSTALAFAVEGDPAAGWRLARDLAARIPAQVRAILMGRENGDVWSPVGARVWAPQAEAFDILVGSGAFTPDEERDLRAGLLLAGRQCMSPELMNWRYGARNANFEADRMDAVGTIGLGFPGHPDGEAMAAHAAACLRASLLAYCTPGSGKWYENPACYYLQSLRCRVAIAGHLSERGLLDPATVPRLREFLAWGLQVLTPPVPMDYETMRTGCRHDAYAALPKVRRLAPFGDHAHVGPWVPDAYALAARWMRASDPALADALMWAWHEGGGDGGYFGSKPHLLAQCDPADLAPAVRPTQPSRRLEGFGAVFRGNQGRSDEFMLLAKLGPGGYRYHRSEGSFILVADGRPLVWDGGEAGEGWRHSTVTYHAAQMPPAPGRIERFAGLPAIDYAQGAFPVVLAPSDPVFLSDVCEHQLVEEAHRRARIARPAASRAWLWVKDGYLVVGDRLDVPAGTIHRWHLQVMAHDEQGDPGDAKGLRFRGRFGTDLQVLLPAGGARPWRVEHLPMHEYKLTPERCVAQRHLSLDGEGPGDWLAVLRPLTPGARPLAAAPLTACGRTVGTQVTGPGIDDRVVLGRTVCQVADASWSFSGSAGACLRRPDGLRLVLLGAGRVAAGDAVLESDGPAAELVVGAAGQRLVIDGDGAVLAMVAGRQVPVDQKSLA